MPIPVFTHRIHIHLETSGLEAAWCTDDPATFESLVRNRTVAVVECPDPLEEPWFYLWLRGLCVTTPGCAIVCVAPLDPAFVSALAPVPCADVIPWERLVEDLPRVLGKWRSPEPEPVLRRIADGASLLRRAWRVDLPGCSPKRVLDWVTLGRILAHGAEASSLVGLSVELGIPESTLERMSMRLTGRTMAVNLRREGLALTIQELAECAGAVFRRALERRERA